MYLLDCLIAVVFGDKYRDIAALFALRFFFFSGCFAVSKLVSFSLSLRGIRVSLRCLSSLFLLFIISFLSLLRFCAVLWCN